LPEIARPAPGVFSAVQTLRLFLTPIAVALALGVAARAAVHIYSIPSGSMAPTLQAGDHIVVTPYHGGAPRRGDIVVFRAPISPEELMVKRIAGTPGDVVDAGAGRMLIVPAGCYFVLGDNRGDSFDSRNWGVLPRERIVGQARMVLWSSVASAHSRLFHPIH
jgi:signal peptidase I